MKETVITSSVLILAMILLRFLFQKRVSRRLIYGAWLLVALRLLIPVQFGSLGISILSQTEPVAEIITEVAQKPVSGPSRQEIFDNTVQDYITQDRPVFVPQVQEQVESQIQEQGRPAQDVYHEVLESGKPEEILLPEVSQQIETKVSETVMPSIGEIATVVWIVGMVGVAFWFVFVNVSFGRKLRRSAEELRVSECKVPVKVSPLLASPCLFGLLQPTVYLTPACVEDERKQHHVLTHELTHLRNGDHIWAWLRCICLCIYWFHPLVWVAASLSKRDCELACDEAALKKLGEGERLAYGKTLLDMVSSLPAPGQLLETATAMHETKKQLKERMKCIVKKPKVFLTAAIILLMVLTVITGCAFSGVGSNPTENPQPTVPTTTTTTTTPSTTVTEPSSVPTTTTAPVPTVTQIQRLLEYKSSRRNPYYFALGDEFSDPREIKLRHFFDGGFAGEHTPTDEEMAELRQHFKEPYVSKAQFSRLPADKMEAELQKYFGISLADLPDSAYQGLTYLESSGNYCFIDTHLLGIVGDVAVQSVEYLSIGNIVVEYTAHREGTHVVILKPNGEDYVILSNQQNVIDDPALQKYLDLIEGKDPQRNPYNMALGHLYSIPKEVKLRYFFEGGFDGEPEITDAEKAELRQYWEDAAFVAGDIYRLPRAKMDAEMQEYFEISLENMPDTAFDGLTYLESTDCYYYSASGYFSDNANVMVVSVNYNKGATVSITYTTGFSPLVTTKIITLRSNGDSWRIISNTLADSQGSTTPTEPTTEPTTEQKSSYLAMEDIPVLTETVALPENPTLQDLLLEPYTGTALWYDMYDMEYSVTVELPMLAPFCDGAKAINEGIRNFFQPGIDSIQEAHANALGVLDKNLYYDAYLNGDVLSIVITSDTYLDHDYYYTYNLDISTGQELTKYDMVQRFAKVSYPEFLLRATYTVYNAPEHQSAVYRDQFENDAISMSGYTLALNGDGELMMYGYLSSMMRSIAMPYDPDASDGTYTGGEQGAYMWLFRRQTDGAFAESFSSLLARSFFLDPESFLKYLSEETDTVISTVASMVVFDLHPEELDGFRALCGKYLEDNTTAKAARAMLTALENSR